MLAEIEEYLKSPQFALDATDVVPPPEQGESEQEFIERATAEIRLLLIKKFG